MADYRGVVVDALKWFPASRKVIPVTPVRVQTPPSRCALATGPGRISVDLTLAGHPTHPGFLEFLHAVEEHAKLHAGPFLPEAKMWYSCVADSMTPSMRLNAFSDTIFFDASGAEVYDPTQFQGCACLLELTGAWTSDTHWGLRWKVVEVKACVAAAPDEFMFIEDDSPTPVHQPPPPTVELADPSDFAFVD